MINIKGEKFGRLKAIKFINKKDSENGRSSWLCECDCGNDLVVESYSLRKNKTFSCGCYRTERVKDSCIKNTGYKEHRRIYNILSGMKTRCYNKKSKSYKNYGGRGIKICDEWLESFVDFKEWALNNGYNDDLTIDRINVNGDYSPRNCRWVTQKEQSNNTRNNRFLEINGRKMTFSQWCEHYNLSKSKRNTANSRLQRGWRHEEIFKNI